MVGKVM